MADMARTRLVFPRQGSDDPDFEVLLEIAAVLSPGRDPLDVVTEALRRSHRPPGDASDGRARLYAALAAVHIEERNARRSAGAGGPEPELLRTRGLSSGDAEIATSWETLVADGVALLPDELRAMIQLVDAVQLTYEDTARLLDLPTDEVMRQVHDARRKLRMAAADAGLAAPVRHRPADPVTAGRVRNFIARPRHRQAARCLEVAELLQAYVDHELAPPTTIGVRRHLRMCRRCGLEARTYRLIKDAVSKGTHHADADAVAELRRFAATLRSAP